jgi:hypothetical protein
LQTLDEQGQLVYYRFTVLAYSSYSFVPAVAIVMRLLQPIKVFLHCIGIKLSLYVDGGRVAARTASLAIEQLRFALLVLQMASWNIQWAKTGQEATQVICTWDL